jgi:hypothetical protein
MADQTKIDPASSGYVRLNLTATNVGNGVAYHVDLQLDIPRTLNYRSNSGNYAVLRQAIPNTYLLNLTVLTDTAMPPGEMLFVSVLCSFSAVANSGEKSGNSRLFLNSSHGLMDITQTPGELRVSQSLDSAYLVPLTAAAHHGWAAGVWFAVIGLPIIAALALAGLITAAVLARKKTGPAGRKYGGGAGARGGAAASTAPADSIGAVSGGAAGAGAGTAAIDMSKVKMRTMDTNYIMTGGKGVRIADGNPTALDDNPEEPAVAATAPAAAGGPAQESTGKRFLTKLKFWITCQQCRQ